ncbi:MAG: tail fiber domain-containing protein [Bacteroidota bacterium]
MKRYLLLSFFLPLLYFNGLAQHVNSDSPMSINEDASAPDGSAILDLQAAKKGLLIPRINKAGRDLINAPALGLLIFQTNNNPGFYYFDGINWIRIKDPNGTSEFNTSLVLNNSNLQLTDAGGTLIVDLSSLQDGINDADADPTNELNTDIILNGTNLETTDGGGTISTNLSSLKDNLGDHVANENIQTNGHWINQDDEDKEGIFIDDQGNVGIDTAMPGAQFGVIQNSNSADVKDTLVYLKQDKSSTYNLYIENESSDPSSSYGIYTKTIAPSPTTSGGTRYGVYNIMTPSANETASFYGFQSIITSGGSSKGPRYGFYSSINVSTSSTSTSYGLRSYIAGTGGGTKYGVYSVVNSGTGNNYGVYAVIGGNNGTQYGIYSSADGASNWAGYFLGQGYFSENVGIIKSSPDASVSLHIKQLESNHGIRIEHHSNTNFWNTGIGVSSLNYRFEFNGTGRAQIDQATGEFSTISDKNLKTNIEPMEEVLDKVLALKPSLYHYKHATDKKKSRGFIAQEVGEIFPDLMRTMDTDNLK